MIVSSIDYIMRNAEYPFVSSFFLKKQVAIIMQLSYGTIDSYVFPSTFAIRRMSDTRVLKRLIFQNLTFNMLSSSRGEVDKYTIISIPNK